MFLLVHLQVLLSVWFDGVLLVLKHGFFHAHELPNCISLECVEQVFQTILEMLCVFIHDLGNDWTFAVVILSRGWCVSVGMVGIFFGVMSCFGNVWIMEVFFMHLLGVKHLGKICSWFFNRWCFGLLFPTFGDLFNIVEVRFLNKLFHIHLI